LFHLLCLGLVLLQTHESRFPLRQFGVSQGDVLNDSIALIFFVKLGGMPVNFRGTQELALRRVEDRTLRDDICQRRSRPFDAERVSIGPANARTNEQLGHEVVADFAVGGEGALHLGSGNRRSRTVREREPDGAIERQRFSLAAGCEN